MSPNPIIFRCMPNAGRASTTSRPTDPTAATTGCRSDGRSTAPQMRDSCAVALERCSSVRRSLSRRSASRLPARAARTSPRREHGEDAAIDPVAELAEQGRQHGQRADHRHEDDDHRAERERRVDLRAGEQQAGHRDQHREAGDQHRLARGGGGTLQRVTARVSRRALLALALDVEERVVDADRHAHQQDHRARRVGGVERRGSRAPRRRPSRARRRARAATGSPAATNAPKASEQDHERERHGQLLGALRSRCRSCRSRRDPRSRRRTRRCGRRGCAALHRRDRMRAPAGRARPRSSLVPLRSNSTSARVPVLRR